MSPPRLQQNPTFSYSSLPKDMQAEVIRSLPCHDLIATFIKSTFKDGRFVALKELLNRDSKTALTYLEKILLGLLANDDLDNPVYKVILTKERINHLLRKQAKYLPKLRLLLFIYRENISESKSAFAREIVELAGEINSQMHPIIMMLQFLNSPAELKRDFLKNAQEYLLSDTSSNEDERSPLMYYLVLMRKKIIEVDSLFFSDFIDKLIGKLMNTRWAYVSEPPRYDILYIQEVALVLLRQLTPAASVVEKNKICECLKDLVMEISKINNITRQHRCARIVRDFSRYICEFATFREDVLTQLFETIYARSYWDVRFQYDCDQDMQFLSTKLNSKQAYVAFKIVLKNIAQHIQEVKLDLIEFLLKRLENPELEQALNDFEQVNTNLLSMQCYADIYTEFARKLEKTKLMSLYSHLFKKFLHFSRPSSVEETAGSLTRFIFSNPTDKKEYLSTFLNVIWQRITKEEKKTIIDEIAFVADHFGALFWISGSHGLVPAITNILDQETDDELTQNILARVVKKIVPKLQYTHLAAGDAYSPYRDYRDYRNYFAMLAWQGFETILDFIKQNKDSFILPALKLEGNNQTYCKKLVMKLIAKANGKTILDVTKLILDWLTTCNIMNQDRLIKILIRIVKAYPSQFDLIWPAVSGLLDKAKDRVSCQFTIQNFIDSISPQLGSQQLELIFTWLVAMFQQHLLAGNDYLCSQLRITKKIASMLPRINNPKLITPALLKNLINQYLDCRDHEYVYPLIKRCLADGTEDVHAIFEKVFKTAPMPPPNYENVLFKVFRQCWNEKIDNPQIVSYIQNTLLEIYKAAKATNNRFWLAEQRLLWFLTQPATTDDMASSLLHAVSAPEHVATTQNMYKQLFNTRTPALQLTM